MSGISFTGLGSGLPVSDIVTGLVNAEKTPYTQRINQQGGKLTTNISANGALKSALAAMESSLEKLKSSDNFQLRSASGTDDFITLTSTKDAQVGNYDVKVNNLAQAQKSMTDVFDSDEVVGEGKISFATAKEIADGETGFSIDVDDDDTLTELRDKINDAPDNESIIATIVTESDGKQRLVMTAKDTGLESAVTMTATKADGSALDPGSRLNDLNSANLTELKPAADASILIDNAITLTSSTNEFKEAIDGITITAKKAHKVDDDLSKASISEDNNLVVRELENFVKTYNEFQTLTKELGKGGGENENSGVLVGDSMLRSVTSKVRNMLSRSFDSNGSTIALSQLGVETDQYGKLSLDKTKLNDAVSENPAAIEEFFVGTEENPGFAATLEGLVKNYTETGGLIDSRIDSYNNQLTKLDDDLVAFNKKMDRYEARLFAQYNAMDALVANLRSTSTALQGQLANLPGVVSNNNS
ncbi:MAG: hypothetical protein BM565_03600 [Gammaproteobacteria bacterium MedPE]|nr:MAG: hypothetical protein BM565_03600 [Gammaproteobacteria bacterium MedPE]